jgi:hypothetical protein
MLSPGKPLVEQNAATSHASLSPASMACVVSGFGVTLPRNESHSTSSPSFAASDVKPANVEAESTSEYSVSARW